MANLELAEIVDAQAIQSLMDDFYKLAHIPMSLDDLKGNVLVGVGWQDICTKFHRAHPEACKHCIESDTELSMGVLPGEYKLYKCKNNMWDIATPIMVGDLHVGNIFSGQFFFEDEPLDYELFRSQARQYGFNEEEYIAALEKVPRLNRETMNTGIAFLTKLANMISQLSYSNIKLAQSLAERDSLVDTLRESEEKYRNIVETANEGIWVVDAETRTTYVNKKMADILGYSQEEMIDRFVWDFTDEEGKAIIELNMEKRQQGLDEIHEFKLICKDGSPLWALINSKSLFDKDGKFMGYLSMLSDITERKRAREALQESERRYHLLFENMLDGFAYCRMLYDDSGHPVDFIYLDTNRAFERLTGLKEVTGKRVTEAIPLIKELHPELFDAYSRVSLTGQPERFEIEFKPLGIWLCISVYSPEREHFIAIFDNITERKHAEEEREQLLDVVQQEKDRLAALINSITDEVWFADTQKNFTLVNSSGLCEFSICAEEEIEVEKLAASLEVYRPDGSTRPVEEAPPLRALRSEVVKNQEEIIRTPVHRELRYRQVSAAPVHDIGGNIIGSVSVVRDITESKKAEEKIQSLANIVESSNDAIITKSLEGIITSWNKGAEQIYGYSAREVLGKSTSIIEPDSLKGEIEQLGEMIKQGEKIHNYETLRLRKDGTIINVSITLSPVFDAFGELTAISAIARDITKSRRAEEKLRESEEKYRNIAETANEGILIIDDKAIVTYANKKMADMLGYKLEEGIGRPIWDFISEESKVIAKRNLEKRLHGINESYELKLIRKDGLPLWVHINAKSLFDENGKFMGSLSMLADITERKKAEDFLANIEIARKQEIHHRIKNNLQVISSLLDLQAEQFNNREDIKDSDVLEAFRESQDRVISMAIIHEELYKGGGIDTLDFSSYVEELTQNLFLTYRLGNINISLNMDLEENLFFDMDTAVPLGMIVNELVSNSLKHAFIGRDKGEIRIKLRRESSEFESSRAVRNNEDLQNTRFNLTVSDNGVGIPENLDIEDLDSLGFQLVTSLVDQLDGKLELKRNSGTEFTMRFTVTEKNNQAC